MSLPKRRHSNQRTRKRRTHHGVKLSAVYVDPNSGSAHKAHNIDPDTGFYRGRQVVTIRPKKTSKTR